MPKLFHKNEWFYELAPTALPEADFERLLIQNADIIRPNTTIVPYRRTVYAGADSARADLAIISNDYRDWMVVEVEMVRHSLHGHVIPQVRTLRGAAYGQADAEYLSAKNPKLDPDKLRDMMRGHAPEILVIVNKADAEWERELRRYSSRMMAFEIYRSNMNRYVFSIDGDLPRLAHDMLTHLEVDRMLPNFLVVASPAALDFKKGIRVPVFINDQLTEWERIDIQTTCYLAAVGRMPLARDQKYALIKTEDGDYAIQIRTEN
jgi:hypothetical protein